MNVSALPLFPARKTPRALVAGLGLGIAALLAAGAAAPSAQAATLTGSADAAATAAIVQAQQVWQGTSISVTGTGTVSVEPDVAKLSFSVTVEEADAAAAASSASTQADAVTAALKNADVDEKDIQTGGVSVYPRYSWSDETSTSSITSYQASVDFEVSGVAVAEVGTVLGAVLDAGVSQVGAVAYYSSDYDALYQQALALAVTQAKGKAQALSAALYTNADEGDLMVESVVESPSSQQYRYADTSAYNMNATANEASSGSASVSGSVQPGTIDIEAEVTVTNRTYDYQGISDNLAAMAGTASGTGSNAQ